MSANFGHLSQISPELHRLGVLAERFFAEDANTSLIKSRQFGEYMLKEIAALSGVYDPATRETTSELLRRLTTQQVLPREVADVFHAVRKSGNEAAHSLGGTPALAERPQPRHTEDARIIWKYDARSISKVFSSQ